MNEWRTLSDEHVYRGNKWIGVLNFGICNSVLFLFLSLFLSPIFHNYFSFVFWFLKLLFSCHLRSHFYLLACVLGLKLLLFFFLMEKIIIEVFFFCLFLQLLFFDLLVVSL